MAARLSSVPVGVAPFMSALGVCFCSEAGPQLDKRKAAINTELASCVIFIVVWCLRLMVVGMCLKYCTCHREFYKSNAELYSLEA